MADQIPDEPGIPVRMMLQVIDRRQALIKLEVVTSVMLGRGADGDGMQPDLNLTPYGAQEAGVSRLHASLENRGGLAYVMDMSSTSGTRINGLPLTAGRLYRLRDNDELELGSLRLLVRLPPQQL